MSQKIEVESGLYVECMVAGQWVIVSECFARYKQADLAAWQLSNEDRSTVYRIKEHGALTILYHSKDLVMIDDTNEIYFNGDLYILPTAIEDL